MQNKVSIIPATNQEFSEFSVDGIQPLEMTHENKGSTMHALVESESRLQESMYNLMIFWNYENEWGHRILNYVQQHTHILESIDWSLSLKVDMKESSHMHIL